MEHSEVFKKIAILIDADNAHLTKLKSIFDEISTHGRIVVKKAYGDWKSPNLKHWEDIIKQLAIKPVQQHAYVSGKNATDIALIIDAMDLLYSGIYDAFVLVSSDSDFTPLAIRLRESGVYVLGVGADTAPTSFRSSCDEFLLTKHLRTAGDAPSEAVLSSVAETASARAETAYHAADSAPHCAPSCTEDADDVPTQVGDVDDIHALLRLACEKYQDEDGFCNVASAGSYLKRARPDFDVRDYGFARLSAFLMQFSDKYKVRKLNRPGAPAIIEYRCS